MKRLSVVFTVLSLISFGTLDAQIREIGAQGLALDDGLGHVVHIKLPAGLTGSYNWMLPITPGGSALTLPIPATVGSILYSNGTNAWLENANLTATAAGALTANSLSVTSGNIASPSSSVNSGTGTSLSLTAGNDFVGGTGGSTTVSGGGGGANGGNITVQGGIGGPNVGAGGQANLIGGPAGNGAGGNVVIAGGLGPQAGGPLGGSIFFQTTPSNAAVLTRMQITPAGLVEIGASNQFQVDQSGNETDASLSVTGGSITSPSSSITAGTGTNLSLTAGNDFVGGTGGSTTISGGGGGASGGNITVEGGIGGPNAGNGGQANLIGGPAGNGSGGNVVIGGGIGTATTAGGAIVFQTTPSNAAVSTRMQVTPAGLVEIGSSNQFQVDPSGNVSTNGTIKASTAAGGLVLGSGANATTLSSTATSARALSLPNAAGTLAVSGSGATYYVAGLNPTGTTSSGGTFVQMGLAGSITPATSGKVLITIGGSITNSSAGGPGAFANLTYGTGAAPANGAAATGNIVGPQIMFNEPSTSIYVPFSTTAIVTGLTVGTTYWIDLQLQAGSAGTASVVGVSISAVEMP